MRLSFEDEANEEIACGREYTPFPEVRALWLLRFGGEKSLTFKSLNVD
jgi:hypothetical protein